MKSFKKLRKILMLITVVTVLLSATTGCTLMKNGVQRAEDLMTAYQTGDMKALDKAFDDDNRMQKFIDALEETEAEGMIEVYQKVWELTKSAEFSVVKSQENTASDEWVTVTIKTVDLRGALGEAMIMAAMEGGDVFADAPTWMMSALEQGGEPVEWDVELRIKSNGVVYDDWSEEFMAALTGGFYSYMPLTMTSCVADDGSATYMVAMYDEVRVSLDEYIIPFEGVEYTDEEVDAILTDFTSEYEGYTGILVGGNRIEDGLRIYMLTDYDTASLHDLEQLGLITAGDTDSIGLEISIDGLEDAGYRCQTTDFGSGFLSEK